MADKRYYFACIDLDGRDCLVVGGGPVALEKTQGLLECGARVTVVSPQVVPELQQSPVEWPRRSLPCRRGAVDYLRESQGVRRRRGSRPSL
jgi:siroheme synthase (precorrin-2 oxidase/ferrochelatase)